MILSELVTNALKYGLNKSGRAEIEVSAERSGGASRIVVKNRIEQDQPIDPISSSKLGSMLVEQLAADFNASVDARTDGQYYLACVHLPG
ncbi:hypothetical protein R2C4_03150 [Leisingera aquaemixtae]|jgi:two-component sensor histidine kinase|nr:hypothetical protein R2C4_03150 [Leisingera aquaemixtae]